MAIEAKAVTPRQRTITLTMQEPDAVRLKFLMTNNVIWAGDKFGPTAQEVWDALDDLDIADEE